DIGMQFHPELIQTMVQRMMVEGHVSRSYDLTGEAADDGDHKITLQVMESAPNDLLRTGFRLWRTSGGFCGWADIQADLGLAISDQELRLDVDNIAITDGAGAGEILASADNFFQSEFVSDMIDVSEFTINYREFILPDQKQAELGAESFRLELDGTGLSVYLNIIDIF
ncbi:MAG: hypothetical protein KC561_10190, partial [Myxococcales bacterium]|nr:hypothetical protein [Myxococcales bacterium]